MTVKKSKITISEADFQSAVTQIHKADTLNNLFKRSIEILGVKRISYHHLLDIGERHAGKSKPYFGYNLPENLDNFFKNQTDLHKDPGVIKVFSTGHFIWLSNMLNDPLLKKGENSAIKRLIETIGDGLLIPLYGPQNRCGYLYVNFGKNKEAYDPLFAWQAQSLSQIAHVRYTLMLLNIQTKIKLTNREMEVLELLTFGKTNPEIGIILNISANTVSGYVKQIFLKLGTTDRVTTALLARSLTLSP